MRQTFFRLVKLTMAYKNRMITAAILGFLTIGSSIGLLMTSAYIIAKAALHPSIADLQVGIVGVRFFGISRGIFRYLERLISHEATLRLLSKFRVWFYQGIEPLAPARLIKYKSGDLLNRIISDIGNLEHLYIRVLAPPVIAALVTVLMFFLFETFNLVFSILLLISFFIAGIGVPVFIFIVSRKTGEEVNRLRSKLQIQTIDSLQGISEILIFGQEERFRNKIHILNQRYEKKQRQHTFINGVHEALIGLIMNFTILAMLLIAIPQVTAATLDGIYLSVIALGIMAAFEAISPLPAAAQHLEQSIKSGQRLLDLVNANPLITDPKTPSSVPDDFSLKFENLSFKYDKNDDFSLRHVSFTVPQGSKIAVVGSSGAGKSTLVNLMLRFWDFPDGHIFIGNRDIRTFRQEDVRNLISVVSQNTYLFNETIQENLSLANPEKSKDELEEAMRQAQLWETVQSLPKQAETFVGEQGFLFSGGERQRLAIARSFLKDAPILILDEPTANLDAFTEQKILRIFWDLSKNKTTVLITHRLVGLENADQILVLKKGKIIQRGTHAELTEQDGWYRRMWQIQNQVLVIEAIGQ
ncbi:MAG TPA: thiol reductant ABC exporter subunit CydC [Bacteroidetes bacterium]|nr:thiol reductant ABC exporter subunit CydC [Bacteroidota bacterium]